MRTLENKRKGQKREEKGNLGKFAAFGRDTQMHTLTPLALPYMCVIYIHTHIHTHTYTHTHTHTHAAPPHDTHTHTHTHTHKTKAKQISCYRSPDSHAFLHGGGPPEPGL